MREVISTPDAPGSIGPFSQGIRANGFVFVSGQVALDPATQKVIDGDVAAQTERTLETSPRSCARPAPISRRSSAPASTSATWATLPR